MVRQLSADELQAFRRDGVSQTVPPLPEDFRCMLLMHVQKGSFASM